MAMSNGNATAGGVGGLTAGVPVMLMRLLWMQVSPSTSLADSARESRNALSIAPTNSRRVPSLPIRNGPGAGGMVPGTVKLPTSTPSTYRRRMLLS